MTTQNWPEAEDELACQYHTPVVKPTTTRLAQLQHIARSFEDNDRTTITVKELKHFLAVRYELVRFISHLEICCPGVCSTEIKRKIHLLEELK